MGTCKQKEIRVIPTSDNVEFTSKSIQNILYNAEKYNSEWRYNISAPSNTVATFIKKDTARHAKRNKKHTNNRRPLAYFIQCRHKGTKKFFPYRNFSNFWWNLCFYKSWDNLVEKLGKCKKYYNLPLRIKA